MKDNCAKSGFGHQVKVEKIENSGAAAAYVSKYIGKSLEGVELPKKFRRVRCSNDWEKLADLTGQSDNVDWLVCNTRESLWSACEECQRQKLTMVDMRTGEYFDYSDACESWY